MFDFSVLIEIVPFVFFLGLMFHSAVVSKSWQTSQVRLIKVATSSSTAGRCAKKISFLCWNHLESISIASGMW